MKWFFVGSKYILLKQTKTKWFLVCLVLFKFIFVFKIKFLKEKSSNKEQLEEERKIHLFVSFSFQHFAWLHIWIIWKKKCFNIFLFCFVLSQLENIYEKWCDIVHLTQNLTKIHWNIISGFNIWMNFHIDFIKKMDMKAILKVSRRSWLQT